MAVKLRLTRMGAKKRPTYRIVASDSRTKRDGEYLELIGTYNPIAKETKINEEVALKWLRTGAQPSDTVRNLLSKAGIMKKFADEKQGKENMSVVELTEFIVKSLGKNTDNVSGKEFETDEENTILIQVLIDQEDMGRVIGKNGKIANSLRTLVQASSYLQDNKKIRIDIDNF